MEQANQYFSAQQPLEQAVKREQTVEINAEVKKIEHDDFQYMQSTNRTAHQTH